MRHLMLATSYLVLLCHFPLSQAEEIRCSGQLIAGDQMHPVDKEYVLKLCGEPDKVVDYYKWHYNEQRRILVFNSDGALVTIRDEEPEEVQENKKSGHF